MQQTKTFKTLILESDNMCTVAPISTLGLMLTNKHALMHPATSGQWSLAHVLIIAARHWHGRDTAAARPIRLLGALSITSLYYCWHDATMQMHMASSATVAVTGSADCMTMHICTCTAHNMQCRFIHSHWMRIVFSPRPASPLYHVCSK
jgi:hypothetical protein